MKLPRGYRLLRTAPEVWVLVELYSSEGVVARYEGKLDPDHWRGTLASTPHRAAKMAARDETCRGFGGQSAHHQMCRSAPHGKLVLVAARRVIEGGHRVCKVSPVHSTGLSPQCS